MTPAETAKLVTVALAAYPTPASFLGEDAAEDMSSAWHMVLNDLTYAEAQAALGRYMATVVDRLPSPGHIRRIVDEARHGRVRAGGDAFGEIRDLQQRRFSSHRPAPASAWRDQRARWVFERLGGWTAWAELTVGADEGAFRKRFIDLYDSAAKHDAEDRAVAGLPGVARPALPAEATPRAAGELVGEVVGEVARHLRLVPGGRP